MFDSVTGSLARAAASDPDRLAVVWEGRRYRYDDLAAAAARTRSELAAHAPGRAPRIGIWMRNHPSWAPVLDATWSLEGTAVLLSGALPASAVPSWCENERLDVLVTHTSRAADVGAAGLPVLGVDDDLRLSWGG